MLTYLIEDDPLKAGQLQAFISQAFPNLEMQLYGSYQSGLRALEQRVARVVLLDMTLPTFDRGAQRREGRSRPQGGYDLMRKMRLRDLKARVIVVTQLDDFGEGDDLVTFEEMTERCEREFPDLFVGSVQFKQSEADWQRNLEGLMRRVLGEQCA